MYTCRPGEGIRSYYRWLWANMWVLGIELRTSGGEASALIHGAISPAPELIFKGGVGIHRTHWKSACLTCVSPGFHPQYHKIGKTLGDTGKGRISICRFILECVDRSLIKLKDIWEKESNSVRLKGRMRKTLVMAAMGSCSQKAWVHACCHNTDHGRPDSDSYISLWRS